MNGLAVSVVMPTYNRAHTLPTAVQSVLDQTFSDFELIVVDDASTDDTAEVMDSFQDPRIRYLRLDQNQGANVARNAGIRQAQGRYIAFQDSDDEWLPHKLDEQMAAFRKLPERFGVVYCKYRKLEGAGSGRVFGEPFDRQQLLQRNYIGTPTMVVHSRCLRDEPFDEQLPRRQDWELCLRLMQICEFYFVDKVLVLSPVSPRGITSDRSQLLKAYQHILDKHYQLIQTSPPALASFFYTIGILQIQGNEWAAGRSHLLKAARCWPLSIKYWMRALGSLCGQTVYRRLFSVKDSGAR